MAVAVGALVAVAGMRVSVGVAVRGADVGMSVTAGVWEGVPATSAVAVAAMTAVAVTSKIVPVSLATYSSRMGTVQPAEATCTHPVI